MSHGSVDDVPDMHDETSRLMLNGCDGLVVKLFSVPTKTKRRTQLSRKCGTTSQPNKGISGCGVPLALKLYSEQGGNRQGALTVARCSMRKNCCHSSFQQPPISAARATNRCGRSARLCVDERGFTNVSGPGTGRPARVSGTPTLRHSTRLPRLRVFAEILRCKQ